MTASRFVPLTRWGVRSNSEGRRESLPMPTNVPLHHTIATLSAPPRCTITSRLRQARGTENVVRCRPVGFSGGV